MLIIIFNSLVTHIYLKCYKKCQFRNLSFPHFHFMKQLNSKSPMESQYVIYYYFPEHIIITFIQVA